MQKLGVFDSGIGGFDVISKLKKHVSVDIVFLADHKNLPYGEKSDEVLKAILVENIQWFLDRNISHILLACNTASTYIDFLREKFPKAKIDSIIEITAAKFEDEENLMIFGTKKTVSAMLYSRHLNNQPNYMALSELATLVEQNNRVIVEEYLKTKLSKIELKGNVLLACTHYSIVRDLFEEILDTNIYDSIDATIDYYKDFKGNNNLEVYTSGNIKILKDQLFEIFDYDVKVNPYNENFKIVVVSDNHGRYEPISKVLEDNKDAAAFIHCGDVELNPELVSAFYVVNGNNDYFYTFAENLLVDIGRLKVYITHGHKHPRYKRLNNVYEEAKALKADIVCYGHEHIFKESWVDGVLLLNPGSLFYNRDNTGNSYAIINVNKDKLYVSRINI